MKSELEVSDDPIDGFMILDEGDHSHLAPACRTEERINSHRLFLSSWPSLWKGHDGALAL
jgi:hypothetical protein